MDTPLDLERLSVPRATVISPVSPRKALPRHKPGDKFLKGPIPLAWLQAAAQQPGKAFHVGVALWFWAGIKRGRTIRLNLTRLEESFGVRRHAASRGLVALAEAKLVSVIRHAGRSPVVTLLDV